MRCDHRLAAATSSPRTGTYNGRMLRTARLAPLLCGCLLLAQDPPDKAKPETLVIKAERTIEFDTDEATWMSVDVSPDDKTLLVDMLGDLYTLPITGGELKPLAAGMQWDYQARYSPDGKQIAFISDRGGSDNIWVMNADGTDPRAHHQGKAFHVRLSRVVAGWPVHRSPPLRFLPAGIVPALH